MKGLLVAALMSVSLTSSCASFPAKVPQKKLYVITGCSPMQPHKGAWSYVFERDGHKLIIHKGYCWST